MCYGIFGIINTKVPYNFRRKTGYTSLTNSHTRYNIKQKNTPGYCIRHLLTDLEQQISNRFQSANRVRCDKTRVLFPTDLDKNRLAGSFVSRFGRISTTQITFIGTSVVSTLTFGRRTPIELIRLGSKFGT